MEAIPSISEQQSTSKPENSFTRAEVVDAITKLLQTEGIIIRMKISLLGVDFNKDTGKWEKITGLDGKEKDSLINEKGFDALFFYMVSLLSESVSTSYLTDEEIDRISYEFIQGVMDSIFLNQKIWGISTGNRNMIVNTLDVQFNTFLKKARNGMTFKGISGMINVGEQKIMDSNRQETIVDKIKKYFGK